MKSVFNIVASLPIYICLVIAHSSPPCPENQSIQIEGRFLNNGSFQTTDNLVYSRDVLWKRDDIVWLCVCLVKPCFMKCCEDHETFMYNRGCHTSENGSAEYDFYIPVDKLPSDYYLLHGKPDCENDIYNLDPEIPEDEYILHPDGRLELVFDNEVLKPGEFCLEVFPPNGSVRPAKCFPPDPPPIPPAYPIGMIISLPFLAMTFIVYVLLRELRNLHGKILISYVFSLLVGYGCLLITQLVSLDFTKIPCTVIGYMVQFAFLATFFWLNVMCFDIWWAFSGMRKMAGSANEREHKKFILYSIYAWGGPLLIFAITFALDYTAWLPAYSKFKPSVGQDKCFFNTYEASAVYFYLPMSVIIFANLTMFINTACAIYKHTKETAVLRGKDSRRHDNNDRERFFLYLKLFIIMGINWLAELISWAFANNPALDSIWFITDITNTLQGVYIFIIFVCKRRVLRLLNTKFCPKLNLVPGTSFGGKSRSKTSTNTTRTESTSVSQKKASLNGSVSYSTEDCVRLKSINPLNDESEA